MKFVVQYRAYKYAYDKGRFYRKRARSGRWKRVDNIPQTAYDMLHAMEFERQWDPHLKQLARSRNYDRNVGRIVLQYADYRSPHAFTDEWFEQTIKDYEETPGEATPDYDYDYYE